MQGVGRALHQLLDLIVIFQLEAQCTHLCTGGGPTVIRAEGARLARDRRGGRQPSWPHPQSGCGSQSGAGPAGGGGEEVEGDWLASWPPPGRIPVELLIEGTNCILSFYCTGLAFNFSRLVHFCLIDMLGTEF